MSRKNQFLVTLFFEILGIGLLLYAASRTLDFVQMTMPADKQYMGYLYLLSTGIGALIWMAVYLKKAKGAQQRGIAFGMGILDLLGEFVMVYADTQYVSSQNGKVVMTQDELGLFILASVGIMAINAIAYYAFKLSDPDANAEQKAQDLVDEISDAAHKQLNTPEQRKLMIDEYAPQIRAAVMGKVADSIADAVGRHAQAVTTPQAQQSSGQAALPSPIIEVPKDKNWLEWLSEKLKGQQDEPRQYEPAIKQTNLAEPAQTEVKEPYRGFYHAQKNEPPPVYVGEWINFLSAVNIIHQGRKITNGMQLRALERSDGLFDLFDGESNVSFGVTNKAGLHFMQTDTREEPHYHPMSEPIPTAEAKPERGAEFRESQA